MSGGAPSHGAVGMRPATEGDFDFLYALHVATMKEYVDQTWGWNDAFQEMRFRETFDPEDTRIITLDGRDIGMIATQERDADLFLALIEIEPEHQRQGIGATLIKEIIAAGIRMKKPVFLHVLRANPARSLYERLGFSVVAETPTHLHMRTTLPEHGTQNG